MAILEVRRTFKGERGDAKSETHNYIVITDDIYTTCAQARSAVDPSTNLAIPAEGSVLPGTTWRAHVEARKNDANPQIFHVTVEYRAPSTTGTTEILKPDEGGKWNVRLSGRTVLFQEPMDRDFSSPPKLIANSAGAPFKGVLRDFYDEEITVEYETDSPDWSILRNCLGKANSDEITFNIKNTQRTFPPNTLRFIDYSWSWVWKYASSPTEPDFEIRMSFAYRPETWTYRVLDEGFYQLGPDQEPGEVGNQRILDADGNPVIEPQPLDGAGLLKPAEMEPVILEFTRVPLTEFAPLFEDLNEHV